MPTAPSSTAERARSRKRARPSTSKSEAVAQIKRHYKVANMLRSALMDRVKMMFNPGNMVGEIIKFLNQVPDIEKWVNICVAGEQYDVLQNQLKLLAEYMGSIRDIASGAYEYSKRLESFMAGRLPTTTLPIPTVEDLKADFKAMERHFSEVIVAPETIAVVTDEIVLKDDTEGEFNFGRFKIVLDLLSYRRKFGKDRLYTVIACDPRYVGEDETYSHPHVSEAELCEGEAVHTIERALNEGRFFDFFHIVNNTLQSYNARSPYMPLKRWVNPGHGCSCAECGYEIYPDDALVCDNCDDTFCSECCSYCESGDCWLCHGCTSHFRCPSVCIDCEDLGTYDCLLHTNNPCEICGNSPSDHELSKCRVGATFCTDCLHEAQDLPDMCEGCRFLMTCNSLPDSIRPTACEVCGDANYDGECDAGHSIHTSCVERFMDHCSCCSYLDDCDIVPEELKTNSDAKSEEEKEKEADEDVEERDCGPADEDNADR